MVYKRTKGYGMGGMAKKTKGYRGGGMMKKPKATELEVKPPKVIAKAVKQLKVTVEVRC